MRAHSDIKKTLMLEKHDDFLRGPPSSSMLPAFRFDSRGFFTCIVPLTFTSSHAARRGSETRGVPTAWSPLARRLFSLSLPDKPSPPTATRKVTFAASPRSPWLLPNAAMRFFSVLDFFSSLLLPHRARLVTPGELGNAHPSNSTGLRRSSPPRRWPCELSLKVVAKARRNYRARVSPVASRVSPFCAHVFFLFCGSGESDRSQVWFRTPDCNGPAQTHAHGECSLSLRSLLSPPL